VVDSAIYEAVLAMMESTIPEYAVGGVIRERSGAILPGIAPSNVYPTSDADMIVMGANQDTVFARLCSAMTRPELAEDPRYASHAARGEHQEELDALIAGWTQTLSAELLLETLESHGVPAGRIYRAPEMLADPQFQARQSIASVPDERFESLPMQNVVPKLSETPGSIRWSGPALGQHNADIYGELLGLGEAEIQDLHDAGVV
jgi:crotonobetainyl-CoA:carnitine CoA-transferase CaiB-like acyl-CoA transferase